MWYKAYAQIPFIVGKIGNITHTSGAQATKKLNDILIGMGTAVGAIVIVVALVKLFMALADQNAVSKQQSSMLFGVGIFMVSMTQVLKALNLETTIKNGPKYVAAQVIKVVGNMLSYAGAVLAVVAIIMLIMSIANEQAEQRAEGVKILGTAIGLLSINTLAQSISMIVAGKGLTSETAVSAVAGFIANVTTYIGGGFAIMAIWNVVNSIRQEDARERDTAIRFFLVAIGLLSIRGALKLMGFTLK